MKTVKDYENLWAQILTKSEYSLEEIQPLRLEIESLVKDQQFHNLDAEQQSDLLTILEDIRYKEEELAVVVLSHGKQSEDKISETNKVMNRAEELFYSGQFAEAIKKYNQVLAVEPNWERAREHRNQASEYLKRGYIPGEALPPEVALLFGKAQSAARVGRYMAALELMNKAKKILTEYGIAKWSDGDEFIALIQTSIEAEEIAQFATQAFNEGRIEEAINALNSIYHSSSHPKYKVLADKYENFRNKVEKISTALYAPNIIFSSELFEALTDLEKLKDEFRDNYRIKILDEKLGTVKSNLVKSIQEKIRNLLSEAEIAQTIDAAVDNSHQAKDIVDQAVQIGLTNEEFNYVVKEVNRRIDIAESDQADLSQAEKLATEKENQSIAIQIIQELHKRYPNDPRISRIRARLGISDMPYNANPPPDDIDNILQKAKELFSQQKIEEAIDLLDHQYKILRVSRLRDLSTEYKNVRRFIDNLSDIIYSGNASEVIEASKTIITLRDKYGDLPFPEPLLVKLNNQLLIHLINSKDETDKHNTTATQDIVIQGLLGEQPAISFHEYYRVLNGMILKDPLNQRLQILLAWVKHEIEFNEKQNRNRIERNKSIDSFRNQAKVWFILSIITAITFLILAIYIILISTQQEDVWVRLGSLFSILPVYISKLVYDQSLAANRRADEMYEKLMDEDARNVELDRLDEKDIRKKVFQEKSKPKQKKTDSNKNTPNP